MRVSMYTNRAIRVQNMAICESKARSSRSFIIMSHLEFANEMRRSWLVADKYAFQTNHWMEGVWSTLPILVPLLLVTPFQVSSNGRSLQR